MGCFYRRPASSLSIFAALVVALVVLQSTAGVAADPLSPSASGGRMGQSKAPVSKTPQLVVPGEKEPSATPPCDPGKKADPSNGDENPGSAANPPVPPEPQAVARVVKVQNQHTSRLMKVKGVVGVATGLGAGGRVVIKVFTKKGEVGELPNQIDGIAVEAEKSGAFRALQRASQPRVRPPEGQIQPADPTQFFSRPVPIGISISPKFWTAGGGYWAGTLGCRVKDPAGKVYILSNNHVMAGTNIVPRGTPILQPGLLETGGEYRGPEYEIGELTEYVRIRMNAESEANPNRVDAAIALSSKEKLGNVTFPGGYKAYKSTPVAAYLGQTVQKCGRTTGHTRGGVVTSINMTVRVLYDEATGDYAVFDNQIHIAAEELFSYSGDSGSLVVAGGGSRKGGRPYERRIRPDDSIPVEALDAVGLLFAGNNLDRTIANPIQDVLTAFGVTLDGE